MTTTSEPNPQCRAVLMIKGEHFRCDMMRSMAPGSKDHGGWAHGNMMAEAIWGEMDADDDE